MLKPAMSGANATKRNQGNGSEDHRLFCRRLGDRFPQSLAPFGRGLFCRFLRIDFPCGPHAFGPCCRFFRTSVVAQEGKFRTGIRFKVEA